MYQIEKMNLKIQLLIEFFEPNFWNCKIFVKSQIFSSLYWLLRYYTCWLINKNESENRELFLVLWTWPPAQPSAGVKFTIEQNLAHHRLWFIVPIFLTSNIWMKLFSSDWILCLIRLITFNESINIIIFESFYLNHVILQ